MEKVGSWITSQIRNAALRFSSFYQAGSSSSEKPDPDLRDVIMFFLGGKWLYYGDDGCNIKAVDWKNKFIR
jgi:hypothetical protein